MVRNHLDPQIWTHGKICLVRGAQALVRGANWWLRGANWWNFSFFGRNLAPLRRNLRIMANCLHFWSNLALFAPLESIPTLISLDLWWWMRSWWRFERWRWILNPLFLPHFSMDFRDLWMEINQLNLQNVNMLLHVYDNACIRFHHWNLNYTFLEEKSEKIKLQ